MSTYIYISFINTTVSTDVLDGGMVVIAIFTYNFCHPGCLLALPNDGGSEKREKFLESDVNGSDINGSDVNGSDTNGR
jgi:hypothetical protein